jgi:hypothetical protein
MHEHEPEMADPGDGDMFAAFASAICEHVGHEWGDAGGGLLICMRCETEKWAGKSWVPSDDSPVPSDRKSR